MFKEMNLNSLDRLAAYWQFRNDPQVPTEEKPAEQPTTTQDATDAALAEVA